MSAEYVVLEEWVEVAAVASYEAAFGAVWEACEVKDVWRRDTRAALAAVLPLAVAQERDRIEQMFRDRAAEMRAKAIGETPAEARFLRKTAEWFLHCAAAIRGDAT